MSNPAPGALAWFEVATSDPDGAENFYGSLVWWPSAAGSATTLAAMGGAGVGSARVMRSIRNTRSSLLRWHQAVRYEPLGPTTTCCGSTSRSVSIPPTSM